MSIDTFKEDISFETNPNKFFITPSGGRIEARINVETGISEIHPEIARRILKENPDIKSIYESICKDFSEDVFLVYYGYILVDAEVDDEIYMYCDKSLLENRMNLQQFEKNPGFEKKEVYDSEIKDDPNLLKILNEILEARENLKINSERVSDGK